MKINDKSLPGNGGAFFFDSYIYVHYFNVKTSLFYLFLTFFLILISFSCGQKVRKKGYSLHPSGYYYQLISFESDNSEPTHNKVAWVSASFSTQSDSIFWDSFNNLNDKFYLENDSLGRDNFLKNYILKCSALDSACVLIRTKDFFRQQFKSAAVPYFCEGDSVVKINLKVKRVLSKEDFVKITHDLRKKEERQIEHFFGTLAETEAALDPLGFYWVYHDTVEGSGVPQAGDHVTVAYRGEYINGRFLEKSGADFEFIYGTPDQLLKGLNYVIGRLKMGENAKIILPSRLAFGENGSSNGTVPPYTPLVYEIQLIDLKKSENTP